MLRERKMKLYGVRKRERESKRHKDHVFHDEKSVYACLQHSEVKT